MKLLLNVYNKANKDKRDKAQLMVVEKKLRGELEDLKQQMRRLQVNFCEIFNVVECVHFFSLWFLQPQESKREGYKKLADEDALQRIKHLEEQNHGLQKQVQMHKQVSFIWKN